MQLKYRINYSVILPNALPLVYFVPYYTCVVHLFNDDQPPPRRDQLSTTYILVSLFTFYIAQNSLNLSNYVVKKRRNNLIVEIFNVKVRHILPNDGYCIS